MLIISCNSLKKNNDISSEMESKNNLAMKLCEMYGLDQGIRTKELSKDVQHIMPKIDSLNFIKLVEFVKEHGMPNKDLVGQENYKNECVQLAAFSILLHNPHRLIEDEKFYNLFLNEVMENRMKGEVFALVIDKYYWATKNEVVYGSQFGKPCIENKNEVNERRKKIGLKELENSEDFKNCN